MEIRVQCALPYPAGTFHALRDVPNVRGLFQIDPEIVEIKQLFLLILFTRSLSLSLAPPIKQTWAVAVILCLPPMDTQTPKPVLGFVYFYQKQQWQRLTVDEVVVVAVVPWPLCPTDRLSN